MRRLVMLLALFALLLTFSRRAEAVPLLVSGDATVAGGLLADDNFGAEDTGGGLLTGSDGSGLFGPYRFYLLFALPAFVPGTSVSSATLRGSYSEDWDAFDDRTHSFYRAPATWNESTITWNNQPGALGGPLGSFNAAAATPGTIVSWDVTAALNAAYLAQNSLFSLLFRADDEALGVPPVINNNLEYFASREFLGGQAAFTIDVVVPEPATLLLLATGLAAVAGVRRRTRLTNQEVRRRGAAAPARRILITDRPQSHRAHRGSFLGNPKE